MEKQQDRLPRAVVGGDAVGQRDVGRRRILVDDRDVERGRGHRGGSLTAGGSSSSNTRYFASSELENCPERRAQTNAAEAIRPPTAHTRTMYMPAVMTSNKMERTGLA